ncbi:hypothetical protein M072_2749 [Bacteroides fragilis str. DS-208]|nr:hypothetical protein M072_2749 [Bacteroides fragilis str. DS-208]
MVKSPLSIRKTGRNGAIFVSSGLFSRELLVTHYKIANFVILRTAGNPVFCVVTEW